MKVKIITPKTAQQANTMSHLETGKIINVTDEFAAELVAEGTAEYYIEGMENVQAAPIESASTEPIQTKDANLNVLVPGINMESSVGKEEIINESN